jgi:hypothetical protein
MSNNAKGKNVGQGNTKMGKLVRRRKLPCVGRLRTFYRERVVRGAVLMSMERKKKCWRSKEEATQGFMKKDTF